MRGIIKTMLTAILSVASVMDIMANIITMIQPQTNTSEYIPIIVTEPKDNHHRSLIPTIEAYYQNETISVMFHKYMGDVYIDIYNSDTGHQTSQIVDTRLETIDISVCSMGTGHYYIIIYTYDGQTFVGEFCLY